jgi:hypothetical protein
VTSEPLKQHTRAWYPADEEIQVGLGHLWREPAVRTLSVTGPGLSLAGREVAGLLVVQGGSARGTHGSSDRAALHGCAAGLAVAALWLPRFVASHSGRVRRLSSLWCSRWRFGIALLGDFTSALFLWCAWEFARTLAITCCIALRQLLISEHLQRRLNTTGRMIAWVAPVRHAHRRHRRANCGVQGAYLTLAVRVACGLLILLASAVLKLAGP